MSVKVTRRRRELAIMFYLLSVAYGLTGVRERARRVVTKLSIRPADLCTCALSPEAKADYKRRKMIYARYRKGIRVR